jgi:hypothetical protein
VGLELSLEGLLVDLLLELLGVGLLVGHLHIPEALALLLLELPAVLVDLQRLLVEGLLLRLLHLLATLALLLLLPPPRVRLQLLDPLAVAAG